MKGRQFLCDQITPDFTIEEIQARLDKGGEVSFAPGIYENASFRITRPVHITGYGAVLIGGRAIIWKKADDCLFCDVEQAEPIRTIAVGGQLRLPCRLPQSGWLKHESQFDVRWLSTSEGGWQRKPTIEELTTLKARAEDIRGLSLSSAEVTVLHSWDDSLLSVKSVNGNEIKFRQQSGHPAGGFGVHDYCLWNVPESFTEAGTFYHDVAGKALYYKPLFGEDETTAAYSPLKESIFTVEGPVKDVEIEGFTLSVTAAPYIAGGFGATAMPGAIDCRGGLTDCFFHHLTIRAVGGYGIRTSGPIERLHIHHCEICQTGAGGLRVGAITPSIDKKSEVAHCRIHHTGLRYYAGIALAATDCHIRHNEVCHTSYSAINCAGSDFIVEKNLLHDTMEVLNDGAAIYSFGSKCGIMRGNLAYGIHPRNGHKLRIAYYLDEKSANWLVEGNVAVDCDRPNHNHMCGSHTYMENLFVNENGGLLITLPRACAPNQYIGNVFSAKTFFTLQMPDRAINIFKYNRIHTDDGTVTWIPLQSQYDESEPVPWPTDESNTATGEVHATASQRVFDAAGLHIDLSDVGPQGI